MKLQAQCVACIVGQASRVAQKIGASAALSQEIETLALQASQTFSFSLTPPEVATPMYEAIARLVGTDDLYAQAKAHATHQAKALKPKLFEMIQAAPDALYAAGKIAVAGNVIDLATQESYDLHQEVHTILTAPFAVDDFELLFQRLASAQTLLYLGDNAGEHIFDGVFIASIKKHFPQLSITFMTRGNAIINDVTREEALLDGLNSYASVESSGVPTPGFILSLATTQAQAQFLNSDVVIAKGMGNFETLTESQERDVFHLFKVKCDVVSTYTGYPLGGLICMYRAKN